MDKDSRVYLNKIIQILETYAPMRLSISSISRELGININKTTKYMGMLELVGEVTMVPFGRSKLYTISQRIPYSSLLDIYNDAIVILDRNGHVQTVNKKFLAMSRLSGEKDLIGRNIIDLNIFSAPALVRNIRMLISESPYEKEIQYIDESSGRIYLIRFIPVITNRGTASIMIDIGDITAQKNGEEKCTVLDRKLKTIFDESQMGIIFINASGDVLSINRASLEMLGIDPSAGVAGLNISELLGNEDWVMMKNNFIIEADIACDFNKPLPGRARTRRGIEYFDITLAPIKSGVNDDLIVEYAIILRDIVAERKAIIELKRNEARYRSYFENTCNGMIVVQPIKEGNDFLLHDFVLKDINKAAEDILKVRKSEVTGKRIKDLFPDIQGIDCTEQLDKVVNQGIPQYLPPMKYRREDNEPWFSHYMFKLPSNEIASFIINVTGRDTPG